MAYSRIKANEVLIRVEKVPFVGLMFTSIIGINGLKKTYPCLLSLATNLFAI